MLSKGVRADALALIAGGIFPLAFGFGFHHRVEREALGAFLEDGGIKHVGGEKCGILVGMHVIHIAKLQVGSPLLNLLDAQRQLLSFQSSLERAVADLATRRAQIEMVTGTELNNR